MNARGIKQPFESSTLLGISIFALLALSGRIRVCFPRWEDEEVDVSGKLILLCSSREISPAREISPVSDLAEWFSLEKRVESSLGVRLDLR